MSLFQYLLIALIVVTTIVSMEAENKVKRGADYWLINAKNINEREQPGIQSQNYYLTIKNEVIIMNNVQLSSRTKVGLNFLLLKTRLCFGHRIWDTLVEANILDSSYFVPK